MEIMVELLCILGAVARQDMAQKLFKPKSLENLLAYNLFLTCPFILKFCIEHGSDAAVLCEKFQKDPTSKIDVIDEWAFTRFEFKKSWVWPCLLYGRAMRVHTARLHVLALSHSVCTHMLSYLARAAKHWTPLLSKPLTVNTPGPLFTKKTSSYQYRDSHYKPETVVRPS